MWGVWPQPSFFVINVRNWRDLWMEPEHGAECVEGRTERQQETGPLVTSLEHWTKPHLNSLLSSMRVITFSRLIIIYLDLIINITAFWAPESVWGQLKLPGLHHSWPLALPHPASSLPQGLILRKFHLGLFFLGNTKHDRGSPLWTDWFFHGLTTKWNKTQHNKFIILTRALFFWEFTC